VETPNAMAPSGGLSKPWKPDGAAKGRVRVSFQARESSEAAGLRDLFGCLLGPVRV